MFQDKEALLLDMNSTFMFGEDRFGNNEDYSEYYKSIGGNLSSSFVTDVIRRAYDYLDRRYPSEEYRHCFPSLRVAIESTLTENLPTTEIDKIIDTFSFHECGYIPDEYVASLKKLREKYTLSLVIDIWSPKTMWIDTFKRIDLWGLFSAYSFSSDHGIVKPSPKSFEMVVKKLGLPKQKCLVIGDSVRRDLGGAYAAGLDCVLVGGAKDSRAIGSFSNLLEFQKIVQ